MRRHETPIAIANALARHCPRELVRLIDPAVGNGVLLEPFFRRSKTRFSAFAVDIDSKPLKRLHEKFSSKPNGHLEVIKADFLDWVCAYVKSQRESFDCVVMNPPFAGQRKEWRSMVGCKNLLGLNSIPDVGPVEAGFILGAIMLLRPGGRLLAVLPASVLTAPSCAWVRGILARTGAIRHVHELPRFSFRGVESRIYLVVYEKGAQQGETLLLHHDLNEPERMVIGPEVVAQAGRLDFAYHSATEAFNLLKRHSMLGWCRLDDLAMVWRGTEKTPSNGSSVVHSSNHVGGFWQLEEARLSGIASNENLRIRAGDILVKRVSRNCARSFGTTIELQGMPVSDCVLVLRPKNRVRSTRLLFAIRCLMSFKFGAGLLEKGTGASYIGQEELRALEIPYELSNEFGELFGLYSRALRNRSFEQMQVVEKRVVARFAL